MKPLSVVLYGLEVQDVQLFHKTFKQLDSGVQSRWRWAGDSADADADLIIVDIDSIHGHMDWLKATGAGQRTVVYTGTRHPKESDLALSKPLLAGDFAAVLASVADELGVKDAGAVGPESIEPIQDTEPETVASRHAEQIEAPARALDKIESLPAPVHVVARPAMRPTRKATPATTPQMKAAPAPESKVEAASKPATIGEWLRIGKIEQPVCISANQQSWVLDPDREAYHGPAALKPMLDALSKPFDSLERADVVALESARKQPSQPLARLRWVAGLDASPGKLLPELTAATSFKLGRWPQIEREYPRHFRIATAMMKQAGNVEEITSASGAPRNEVIDFINAYHTLGYIVSEGEPEQAVVAARDGMMSRIRKPFGR